MKVQGQEGHVSLKYEKKTLRCQLQGERKTRAVYKDFSCRTL